MRRRTLLGAAIAAAVSARASAQDAWRQTSPLQTSGPRRMRIENAHTGEVFSGPYSDGRSYDEAAMRDLESVLADRITGESRPFDARVFDILWELGQGFRMEGFSILSGYRCPSTNRLVGGAHDSLHMSAMALDVDLTPSGVAPFAEKAMAMGQGGVGIYHRASFVHLDCGPLRHWVGKGGMHHRRKRRRA